MSVVLALGRGGQAKLHGWREVVEDYPTGALVIGTTAMALVDDDKVEKIGRVLAKVRRWLAVLGWPAHEGLKDREEDAAVLGHPALLLDLVRCDTHEGIVRESREGVVGLVQVWVLGSTSIQ